MSILRKHQRGRYTVVSNELLNDSRLSFRARGVLAYLLSKPDGWRVRRESIAAEGKEGREAIRRALLELREAGYYHVRVERMKDGTLASYSDLFEEPREADPSLAGVKPIDVDDELNDQGEEEPTGVQKPDAGQPDTGSPDAGKLDALVSTGSKHLEKYPPTPANAGELEAEQGQRRCPQHRGQEKPPACRACGTNPRALAKAAKTHRPQWCGECVETTRLLELSGGGVARCPSCHPLTAVRHQGSLALGDPLRRIAPANRP